MKIKSTILKMGFILIAAGTLLVSCTKEEIKEGMKYGRVVSMGDGEAKSFLELDSKGVPISLGVKFSGSALKNLPAEVTYNLDLPANVDILPFKDVSIDWADHGHDPPGVYDVPHFGFHFYYITREDRMGIESQDSTQFALAPDAKYVPETFAQTPGGVSMQGAHWINTEAAEWNGGTFSETFLYGTYDGSITFLEPMLTMDYLHTKPDASFSLKQPAEYLYPGYHPMSYEIKYDEGKDEYTVSLNDLIMRQ